MTNKLEEAMAMALGSARIALQNRRSSEFDSFAEAALDDIDAAIAAYEKAKQEGSDGLKSS
jgi:hypothetical protein